MGVIYIWHNGGSYSDKRIWIVEAPADARVLFGEPRLGGYYPTKLMAVFNGAPEWLNGTKPSSFVEWLDEVIDNEDHNHPFECASNEFEPCTCFLRPLHDLAKKMKAEIK